VFKPPLSQQRYQHVADVLRVAGARNILDLGCGDGKLLEFLLSGAAGEGGAAKGSAIGWQRLTGLDVSESAVARGSRRLQVPCSSLDAA
jgi:syndecan 1